MKNKHSWYAISVLLIYFLLVMPTNAVAKGIFDHQDTVIPPNQTVDDVIVIGGDATILGNVSDAVIVINGGVELKSSARVDGFVLVIGGNVRQEKGAVVKDEVMNFSFDTSTQNSLFVGGGLIVGTWLTQLAISILLVLLSVLTVFVSKGRMVAVIERARRAPGSLISIGFFSSLILSALSVLLLVTIIGIPLAVVIILFIAVAFIYGLAVLSLLVGSNLQMTKGRSDWLIALTGASVIVSFINIPLIGALIFLVIVLFSTGIMTMLIRDKWRKKRRDDSDTEGK
ncbi:hypothetical protein ACFPES_15880 [Paenibacillus sp. GCM10023248]|uniref:hypothetical protein n=1 Tax=unclassified Paenibacillus TaxID=185978 RepID=UPI002379F765|nr:hypothetical protein [Paenibacillus sp. MAHUQ-63]MDD9268518.1 hypothetical protein [Paenibacillus sp. MAHUQ-63]